MRHIFETYTHLFFLRVPQFTVEVIIIFYLNATYLIKQVRPKTSKIQFTLPKRGNFLVLTNLKLI
jgi:hypothetical protein